MKKLLALLTAFILLLGFCAGAEEAEPVFATLGQAMEEAEFEGNIGGDGTYWVVVVVKDGTPLRVIAETTEETEALSDARFSADIDNFEAAQAAFDEHLKTLPVARTEELTVQPLSQEELDLFVGKTIGEVMEAGFEEESIGSFENEIVFEGANGIYLYEFTLNESYEVYVQHSEEGDCSDLTVKSVRLSGFSRNAVDLRFHADGTVDPVTDGWSEFNELFETISQVIEEAQNGGEVDKEAVIARLTEILPDMSEEDLRELVDLFLLISSYA